MASPLQVRSEHWKTSQRFLGDDAQLERNVPEQAWNVVDALMVGDEHVGLAAHQTFEPLHCHVNAGGGEDQPRPRARAGMAKVTTSVEEARCDRRNTKDDR